MSDAVAQAVVKLFETERFYAEIVATMQRVTTDKVPIAGVCIRRRIELHINPKTFDVLPLKERAAVLKHECEHILRDHIARSKELDPTVYAKATNDEDININAMKHKTINIAADMAINGGICHLPDGAVYAKDFELPDGLTMEQYLAELKDNEKAKGFMDFDGHPLWAESEEDKDVLKEKVRQAVNGAAKKTRAAGKMTGDQELLVNKLNEAKIDWKAVLKRFIGRQIDFAVDTSRKKRNRRYGITQPGIVRGEEMLHIGVAIDTSGSVPDEALHQFMCEIEKIAKYCQVTVVEADSEIKKAYPFKPKKEYVIEGRGGTAYQPAFDYFNVNKVDAVVYFGDMDNFGETISKPKYPVLWAIFGSSEPPADFGTQVKVVVTEAA